jgi:hypothetical protein
MPGEYKDPKKQEAARLGNKKRYEDPIAAGTGARTNLAEDGSDSKTEQESGRFEDADRGPDVKPTHKLINQLQNELKNVRDTYEARLKEEKEKPV